MLNELNDEFDVLSRKQFQLLTLAWFSWPSVTNLTTFESCTEYGEGNNVPWDIFPWVFFPMQVFAQEWWGVCLFAQNTFITTHIIGTA